MMNLNRITRGRGGDRHPLSVRQFILDHLSHVGEDYTAAMHRAYNAEMDELAIARGRKTPYRKASQHSFYLKVWVLAKEGLIVPSGRREESDDVHFEDWDQRPMRKYFRLA